MSNVPRVLKTIFILMISALIYPVSLLVPKDDDLWAFGYGGGKGFTDNSKHLYLHCSNLNTEIRPVWFTKEQHIRDELRNHGYEAYLFSSLKGNLIALRSGYSFLTHTRRDVPWWTTGRTVNVRLGHGIPFKKFAWSNSDEIAEKGIFEYIVYKYLIANYSYTISSSEKYRRLVSESVKVRTDHNLVSGIPRQDMFERDVPDIDLLSCNSYLEHAKEMQKDNSELLFYFPTWRRGSTKPIPSDFDFKTLNEILKNTNRVLYIGGHPLAEDQSSDGFSNIYFLPNRCDFYPILNHIDIFITDYSSLFYDALYSECDLVFFPHDLEEYLDGRELFFDYDSLPGEKVYSTGELFNLLSENTPSINQPENYQEWIENSFSYRDGRACDRIFHYFNNK